MNYFILLFFKILLKGDWGVAVAAWRGMKKGQPGVPGELNNSISGFTDDSIFGFPGRLNYFCSISVTMLVTLTLFTLVVTALTCSG